MTDTLDKNKKKSLNPGDQHAEYLSQVASGLTELENHANDPANGTNPGADDASPWKDSYGKSFNDDKEPLNSPSANINNAKSQEDANSPWKNNYQGGFSNTKKDPLTLKAMARKKGPIGLIIALIGGGGLTVGTLLSPSLILVQLKTLFTNDLSDSTPAVRIHSNNLIGNKIGSKVAKTACAKVGILCKMSTMSDEEVKNYKDNGFKVDAEKTGDRNIVRSVTPPENSPKLSTPDEAKAALDNNTKVASLFQRIVSPATQFVRGDFFSGVLGKIGLSKVAKVVGDTKEKVRTSYRQAVGADVSTGEGGRFNSLVEKGNAVKDKLGKAAALEIPCMAYNLSRVTLAGIQAAKMLGYASIALAFVIGADRILAGVATPEETEQLGNQVSQPDNRKEVDGKPNPDYGKTATDSEGFKLVADGDVGALPGYAIDMLLAGSGALVALNSIINTIQGVPGGKQSIKTVCKVAQKSSLAACASGVGLAICAFMWTLGGAILGKYIGDAIKGIVTAASKINFDDTTVGPKVGQAIFLGVGFMMYHMWQSYGMKPSSKADIKAYAVDTAQIRQQDVKIAKYDARSQPLNVYNQYSFLGSIASSLNLAAFSNSSLATNTTRLLGMIPSAFASATTVGAAGIFQPQQPYNDKRYDICPSDAADALKNIGVDPDASCLARGTQSRKELAMDSIDVTKYMVDNGHIDELSGEAKSDDYKKFVANCGADRTDPLGYTSGAIEEGSYGDEDWASGKKCTDDNDMMSNFRVYTMLKPANDTMGAKQKNGDSTAFDSSLSPDIASILMYQGAM